MINIDPRQFELFVSLFRGRTDVWARYWEKNGKSGYSPAYEFDWDEFMAHKNRGGSLKDFTNKRLTPLTPDIVKKHLILELICKAFHVSEFEKEASLDRLFPLAKPDSAI